MQQSNNQFSQSFKHKRKKNLKEYNFLHLSTQLLSSTFFMWIEYCWSWWWCRRRNVIEEREYVNTDTQHHQPYLQVLLSFKASHSAADKNRLKSWVHKHREQENTEEKLLKQEIHPSTQLGSQLTCMMYACVPPRQSDDTIRYPIPSFFLSVFG